jgi:hypothetical protein
MPRKITIAQAPDGGGIAYLAVLAYPESRNGQEKFIRAGEAGSCYADYIYGIVKRGQIPPEYRRMKNTTIDSSIREGLDRIRRERLPQHYFVFIMKTNGYYLK